MKKLMMLLSLVLACGSADREAYDEAKVDSEGNARVYVDGVPQITELEAEVRQARLDAGEIFTRIDGDPDSDVDEKYFRSAGFGTLDSSATRCGSTVPLGHVCEVQHDKKARFKYTGPAASTQLKQAFDRGLFLFAGDLSNANWSIAGTTGSTNESVVYAPIAGDSLGTTVSKSCGASSSDIVVTPGQGANFKCHGCTITIDVAKTINGLTDAQLVVALTNVHHHEMAHCEGLGHRNEAGQLMHPVLQSVNVETPMLAADRTLFHDFMVP